MTMQRVNGTPTPDTIERLIALGDIDGLQPLERVRYYQSVCDSLGLNAATQPFAYLRLNGKTVLYAKRDATDQLRKIHTVAIVISGRERSDDLYIVTARASTPDGRTDESTGAVSIAGLKGESLANAIMKAETKAKRRVTLSICGLGFLDETEASDVKSAKPVHVTVDGEIVEAKPEPASAPQLVDQLAASIDWAGWADAWIGDFDRLTTRGAITEAWASFNDDVRKLDARKHAPVLVEQVKEAKDRAKGRLS